MEQIGRDTAKKTKKGMALGTLTKIAMLSAVAGVLMLFETPLWFAPPFYKLDLSELAVMVGALSMGPTDKESEFITWLFIVYLNPFCVFA